MFNEDYMSYEPRKFDFSSVCGNFERALSKFATDNTIEISTTMGYFNIKLQITTPKGKKDKKGIFAPIKSIEIEDTLDGCFWSWSQRHNNAIFRYTGKTLVNLLKLEELELLKDQKMYRSELQLKNEDTTYYNQMTKEDPSYFKRVEELLTMTDSDLASNKEYQNKYKTLDSVFEYECDSFQPYNLSGKKIILDGENINIRATNIKDDCNISSRGELTPKDDAKLFSDFFKRIREDLRRACGKEQIMFVPAHESPLNSFFYLTNNEPDYNTLTICNFYRNYIEPNDRERINWVCKRMKELGIGEDFEIKPDNSDSLKVSITNSSGKEIPLADNGRGAVQLFMLLLRLAKYSPTCFEEIHILPHRKDMIDDEDNRFPDGAKRKRSLTKLIIFEEPEQNLHPNLQSKLADLFLDVHKRFGINVLVETHSEYLVRRSQVLVAEAKYKDEQELADKCSFKVYYFPENETPYDMEYQITGAFKNNFGDGFFDEAGKMDIIVLRNENYLHRRR